MSSRVPLRPRAGVQRTKNADENASSKLRQTTSVTAAANRASVQATKQATIGIRRPVLNEVTTTAVNRKNTLKKLEGKGKGAVDVPEKRVRSTSVQDVAALARHPAPVSRVPASQSHTGAFRAGRVVQRISQRTSGTRAAVPIVVDEEPELAVSDREDSMDVEEVTPEREVEEMIEVADSDEEDLTTSAPSLQQMAGPQKAYLWPEYSPAHAARYAGEIKALREQFAEEEEEHDSTMVHEYAEEIFAYMNTLEDDIMPSATYMDDQNEITWAMRQTLVDWLVQVHLRYHMLPETLWIAINIIDRFLTHRVVSLEKLQLVGVTAMFVASKYEEVLAPSADEFVFMTENAFTKKEILKGERIILMTLDFKVSHYCSPYSWMRKISKADDYDMQTRTLSKFIAEVCLHDHRFLRVKPSMVAAIGMYTARKMLGGDWDDAFVYYSGFTEEQLQPGFAFLIEKMCEPGFDKLYVYKKYAHKKFLKAAAFAVDRAREMAGVVAGEGIIAE